MTNRKFMYVLYPGYVRSRDGQLHYVYFHNLAHCYRLNYGECLEPCRPRDAEYFWFIHLKPRPLGDYIEWKEKCIQLRKDLINEVEGQNPTSVFNRVYREF